MRGFGKLDAWLLFLSLVVITVLSVSSLVSIGRIEYKKTATVRVGSVEKMRVELETVIANDILETRSEGLLVVDRNNREREFVHYHMLGSPVTENATANELARRVVRVYRVKTPEWKKLIVDLYKVSAELSKQQ